jgi:CIC family chloride channel protein
MYASVIASSLTIGLGGSAGVEGPSAATGAAIGSNLAGLFRLGYTQRVLLLGAGTAAAIAAIFKAPITGIVFVIEILMLDLKFSNLVPLLVSTATATLISYLILGKDIIYNIKISYEISLQDIGLFIILAITAGLISYYYFKTYVFIHDFFEKSFDKLWQKILAGGLGIGLLVFLLPPVYGEGFEFINNMLNGDFSHVVSHSLINIHQNPYIQFFVFFLLIILAKPIATSLTFAAGGVGGDFAPSLFIGANFGAFFALFVNYFTGTHLNITVFTLIGMAATLSGILHAPLTAIFLIAEITGGYNLFIPLMIVSAISFYTSTVLSKESIYTYKLSKRGDLITHDKDQSAINLIDIEKIIETNFKTVHAGYTIKDLRQEFEQSTRNLFPVLDDENKLIGVIYWTV